MSINGHGPLGTFGWSVTTHEALKEQFNFIINKYNAIATAISNVNNVNNEGEHQKQPFPSLTGIVLKSDEKVLSLASNPDVDILPAAVFTASEKENWPSEKRLKFHNRKRDFSDQPQDVIDETKEFRKIALESLKRRHDAIENLPKCKYELIHQLASWISAIVVNIRLRETLIYPLIRDQLSNGKKAYINMLYQNDELRNLLRSIRLEIYENPSSTEYYKTIEKIQNLWQNIWEKEEQQWMNDLNNYMQNSHVTRLREISISHKTPNLPELNPPTSHDLNYGQQLKQMFEICYTHMIKSGNMQGIPRPRHEPDWACTDGFEPLDPSVYGINPSECGNIPESTLNVNLPKQEPEPKTSNEIPKNFEIQNAPKSYLSIGTSLNRIIELPDATSKEHREEINTLLKQQDADSVDAHKRAYLKQFGSEMAEELAKKNHIITNSADKVKALNEYIADSVHTTDLEGSYYYDEVTLAFRNHGTHWESLSMDITPLGEHYLLIHYDVMYYERLEQYRLKVHGCVKNPVSLSLSQVKELGKDHTWTMPMIMECSGNGRTMMKPRYNRHVPWGLQAFGCYCWTGIPLRLLLQHVGVTSDCVDIVFTGYDAGLEHGELRYFQHSLEIHNSVIDYSMVVWAHNGVDLLPEHGYPLRLMVPAWYGNANIKWLQSIELINRKFKGVYQRTYSYTRTPTDNDIACPSQELRPRAMLKPIGYPDFTTRKRTALAGKNIWMGRAWVGGGHYRAIIRVDISMDSGKTWVECKMEPRLGIFGWHRFELEMDLEVGVYKVMIRATDNLGQQQKVELDDWNWASMQDDAMQKMDLIVVDHMTFTE